MMRDRVVQRVRPSEPPAQPAAPGCPADDPARRRVLATIVAAASAGVAALLGAPAGWLFVRPAVRIEPPPWRAVGRVADFRIGGTVKVDYLDAKPVPWAGFAAQSAAWLRRESETEFVAFTLYCTHTGCPVRWEEGAGLFLCPCHGGAFHRDGAVAAGPPPQPLTRYPVRVRDGSVELQPQPLPQQLRT
jgi:menaquinol-cytochrome c reductase iron-sulfur subunit